MRLQRNLQAAFVIVCMMFLVLACGRVKTKEIYGMRAGVYCDSRATKETFAAFLELEEDGTGSFFYCGAFSHLPFGIWTVENGQMILTEDMLYADATDYRRYVFDIVGDTLVFRQDLSWQLWDYEDLYEAKDGDVFVFSEEMTKQRQ